MKPILLLCLLGLCGCSPKKPPVAHDPMTFRVDVALLIAESNYRGAVAMVQAADVERQLAADGAGYMAIGEDAIVLPGIDATIRYDRSRDCLGRGHRMLWKTRSGSASRRSLPRGTTNGGVSSASEHFLLIRLEYGRDS
jgi:hypothetical protein